MTKISALLSLLAASAASVSAYNAKASLSGAAAKVEKSEAAAATAGRRDFLTSAATTAASLAFGLPAAASLVANPQPANAGAASDLTDVYFGVGCFWHIQHEFVEAERKLLGRGDKELTSLTGYAGGKSTDKEGRVCYHNFQSIADYGKLGHGEVVGMKIPESSIGDFAKEYFDLFTPKGERVDPGDRGGEYRSLIGLPGGVKNPRYAEVEAAATAKGMTLEAGKGNDPDTLGKKLVFVYDTAKFPFYQAEVYHQFHNDFQSPAYGKKYNDLVKEAVEDDRVKITG
eukprot:CAMPEP_0185811706 /NCGR_PEP_ID=MMETSP1322-20130828/8378_1 /TAXON_ID=265543 /ORGANISM="Minutocellus polymorphus, Strain RCC2270" /LENGTH=285 /DNA_ID=CAMNT_0028508177 /DNA_START=30 /DNA_END=884 /DNA_ORIENTATION=-